MLSMSSYTQNYVDECRKKVDLQLSTYKNMIAATKKHNDSVLDSAIESFETNFFNHMVLVLVRMLCESIMLYDNKMTKETKSVTYDPAKSVLMYQLGDEIKLKEEDFELLFKAFFSEMETKFVK
jgi:hypothetical protein